MKFRATCLVVILIVLFSTFGSVLGSENVTDLNKTKQNLFLNNSVVKNNTTNTSTIYVDQARGNDANPGTSDNPKKSIKAAVDVVKENGTLNVTSGQYSGTDNTNFNINKSITITGQDAVSTTINGNNNQIWSILDGKTVSIQGFTFLNGRSDQGGAINNLGYLNISRSVFKNNVASTGGAIYNKNNLEINNCQFVNNVVNQGNGLGGAIYTRQGVCKVVESIFDSNSAVGDGGAINNNYNGKLILINTTFQKNNARSAGALSNAQDCDITFCTFIHNTADCMGGALYSMGNLNIDNSQFNENIAKFDAGGAIGTNEVESSYSTKISNSNFQNNHAKNYGAISSNAELSISNTNFISNCADENGGAIGSTKNLKIENSNFSNNKADKYGGAIYGLGGLSKFISNDLTNNTAEIGGAVVVTSASIFNTNKFTSNSAKQGGAIYNSFKGDASYPSVKMDSNDLTKNIAEELGGAIVNSGAITMTLNNFTMNQITSEQGFGGAIINSNGTIYMDGGNEFFHNVINENIINSGGGISNFDGHIFVSGEGNHFTDSNILNRGYLVLQDCIIEKNTEDGNYLDNTNSKGFTENKYQIIRSNHYYQTITQKTYDHFVINGENHSGKGAPTHLDHVNSVNTHKGDKVYIKSQLWTSSYWPWDVRVDSVTVKFRLYDKNGTYVDEGRITSWKGYAEIDIDTSNLKPGDYCLLVSYDGEDPSNTNINNPIYLSCLRSVPFTVTG